MATSSEEHSIAVLWYELPDTCQPTAARICVSEPWYHNPIRRYLYDRIPPILRSNISQDRLVPRQKGITPHTHHCNFLRRVPTDYCLTCELARNPQDFRVSNSIASIPRLQPLIQHRNYPRTRCTTDSQSSHAACLPQSSNKQPLPRLLLAHRRVCKGRNHPPPRLLLRLLFAQNLAIG